MAERIQLLALANMLPPHFFVARLVPLSKVSSNKVTKIKDVRPLGVAGNYLKFLEKATKETLDILHPQILGVGEEQVGAVKGRSALDNITALA